MNKEDLQEITEIKDQIVSEYDRIHGNIPESLWLKILDLSIKLDMINPDRPSNPLTTDE